MKQPNENNQKTTDYKEPGTGAIEFAGEYVKGLSKAGALTVIEQLMAGELHDSGDKRIKRCDYCQYLYRDHTRPNNSKTCSHECKVARDTLKRAKKKTDKELLEGKPKKKTMRDEMYARWLEYPFWLNEEAMLRYHGQHETNHSPRKIEQIAAAKQRTERMGGRRIPRYTTPYQGDKADDAAAQQHKVRVKIAKNKESRKPGEVKTSSMNPGEITEYLSGEYSERHLRLEHQRASDKKRWP